MSLKLPPKASIVTPNWDGKYLLKICLPSFKKQTYNNFEVIIIDNGSSDGSVSYIKTHFPEFNVVELEENMGFAKAVNLGINRAKGDYIILINNDTRLDKNCLKYLIQAADNHPEIGMVAAKMLKMGETNTIDSAGDYIDACGHANNIGQGEKDSGKFNHPKYVFLVNGGGGLFKKEVFQKVGLFDEDYFAYFEDVDLGFRAQLAGFKGYFEPKAVIWHIHKATSNRNRGFTEYLQFRNMTMTVIKNFPKSLLIKNWNWLKILLVNINTIVYLARIGYLSQALKAESYILYNIFKLLRKRKKIQSTIRVSDDYIVSNIVPKKITLFGLLKPGF